MVSEDLIIGMELNFLKTKRKKKKGKEKREERKKERKERDWEEGKTLPVRPRKNFSTKSSVVMYEPLHWKRKRKASTRRGQKESKGASTQFVILTYISAIYHLILGKTLSVQIWSIKQNKKNPLSLGYLGAFSRYCMCRT